MGTATRARGAAAGPGDAGTSERLDGFHDHLHGPLAIPGIDRTAH